MCVHTSHVITSSSPHHRHLVAAQPPHYRYTTIVNHHRLSLTLTRRKCAPTTLKTPHCCLVVTPLPPNCRPAAAPPLCYRCNTVMNLHCLSLALTRREMCTIHIKRPIIAQLLHHRHLTTLITTPLSSPITLLSLRDSTKPPLPDSMVHGSLITSQNL
ncbi:hypothetical protein VNO78_25106 [Psophocarpus tetragonolobus]|uniref:Uncharacterized protein n=1 Tax=Psophocarpus tetragonolobus TaxID=3891 RepID=A0AAN9S6H1_PSOTE